MDDGNQATIKEKADALWKRAQSLQTSLRRAATWLRDLSKAVSKEDWLGVQELFADKTYAEIKEGNVFNCSSELQDIEREAANYSVDADLQLKRHLREGCEKAGITPVVEDGAGGFTAARLIKIRLDPRTRKLSVRTIAKIFRFSATDRKALLQQVAELHREIWTRRFDADQFLEALYAAYSAKSGDGEEALIRDVHEAHWRNLQPEAFLKAFDLSRARNYTSDMFSVDLARLLESGRTTTKHSKKLRLATHRGGLPVYDSRGQYQTYKFIRFDPV